MAEFNEVIDAGTDTDSLTVIEDMGLDAKLEENDDVDNDSNKDVVAVDAEKEVDGKYIGPGINEKAVAQSCAPLKIQAQLEF